MDFTLHRQDWCVYVSLQSPAVYVYSQPVYVYSLLLSVNSLLLSEGYLVSYRKKKAIHRNRACEDFVSVYSLFIYEVKKPPGWPQTRKRRKGKKEAQRKPPLLVSSGQSQRRAEELRVYLSGHPSLFMACLWPAQPVYLRSAGLLRSDTTDATDTTDIKTPTNKIFNQIFISGAQRSQPALKDYNLFCFFSDRDAWQHYSGAASYLLSFSDAVVSAS